MSEEQAIIIGFFALCGLGGAISLFINRGNGTYPRRVTKDNKMLKEETYYWRTSHFFSGFLFTAGLLMLSFIIVTIILTFINI